MESPERTSRLLAKQPVPDEPSAIAVEVVHCPDRLRVDRERIGLGAGATVADALQLSSVAARHPELQPFADRAGVGIHGRIVALDTLLQDGDRIELYRALQVEPKEARRARQRAQKAARSPRQGRPAG